MAELIGAAIFASATSTAAVNAAIFVASYAGAINAIGLAAGSALLSSHQKKKAERRARDAYNASLTDRLVMTATAQGARRRVYGRVRVGGDVVFKATHGTNNEFYTLVLSLAGHEIDAVEQIYFDDVAVSLDGSGYVTTAPWSDPQPASAMETVTVSGGSGSKVLAHTPVAGSVYLNYAAGSLDDYAAYSHTPGVAGSTVTISGASPDGTWYIHYQWEQTTPRARVRSYLGGASQDLYADLSALVGAAVDSTDKFANDACLIVTLQYDVDAFVSGVPNISAVVRGALVYDPRSTLTEWTENPALIARDWALYAYGGGADAAELVAAAFTAAANACDTSTDFETDAGTETRPLYQCGIAIPLDGNPDEALDEIVEAMAGRWGWAGGLLTVRAGAYSAPVATIDESWISDVADIEIVAQTATAELLNVARATISDAAQGYAVAPLAEVRAAAYVAADGRDLAREVSLGGVTRAVHAQHVMGVLLRQTRQGLTVTLPCNLRAWQLELFDVVAVTLPRFGWSAKAFEVLGWRFQAAGGVLLTLRETSAAVYTPDELFDTAAADDNTYLSDPTSVEQLTLTSITSGTAGLGDGSLLARVLVEWSAATDEAVRQGGRIEVQYLDANLGSVPAQWPAAPPLPGTATSTTLTGLPMGHQVLVRVRAVNALGVRGPWSVQGRHTVTASTAQSWQIEPGAAAEVTTVGVAGPVSDSLSIGATNIVADATCKIVVTATGTMTCTNGTGSTKLRRATFGIYVYGDIGGGGSSYGTNFVTGNIANGESTAVPVMAQYTFDGVAAGDDSTFSVQQSNHAGAGIDQEVENVVLTIEVIKR